MIEVVSPAGSISTLAFASFRDPIASSRGGFDVAHAEFQDMLNDDGSSEDSFGMDAASVTAASASSSSGSSSNGFMQLVGNVEAGRADMQSALVKASRAPSPEALFDANKALSRYDLQMLLLSKIANKGFQAVDRLTNLS